MKKGKQMKKEKQMKKGKQTKKRNTQKRKKRNTSQKKTQKSKYPYVKQLIVKKRMTDQKIKDKQGHFFNATHYDTIIKRDTDVYWIDENNNKQLLLSFRKNVIPQNMCNIAFNSLKDEAKKTHPNRGAAAGMVDIKNLPNYVGEIVKVDKYRVFYKNKKDNKLSKDNIGNMVSSGIIGYYDQPDRNNKNRSKNEVPCRLTQFTRDEVENWKQVQPFIKKIDSLFKKLVPNRHKAQLQRARKTSKFQIKDTAFSTLTLNYNFRTATHRDKGDLEEGFGNLVVLEKPGIKYSGGYLGFPQFKVAVDLRQGDFLAMDVHQWHSNTKLTGKTILNKRGKREPTYGRLSVVCYLRKNMIKCAKK